MILMASVPPEAPPLPFLVATMNFKRLGDSVIEHCDNSAGLDPLCDLKKFNKIHITQITPIAQSGPNCGIAALAMVASSTPCTLSVTEIFEKAKEKGYTRYGEMFSVKNMKLLVEEIVSSWFKVEMFSDGLFCNMSYLMNSLFDGDLMLVPYDADRNHFPCCKEGHKAHWALVCGVLTDVLGQVSVAVRHGKSSRLAVWPLDKLQQSNDNLVSLDPVRASDGRDYVLPEGGVKAGLASQFILLHRLKKS